MSLPTPRDFGLPDRFSSWWGSQEEAFERAITTDKRVIAMVAPTGFGKTPVGETLSMFWGARVAYLVVSRALQSQILGDFTHRFDVRGKQNYPCRTLLEAEVDPATATCDQAEGLCEGCQYKDRGCAYFDAVHAATLHDYPLTNYSMWFAMARFKEGLGKFAGLVCDEAHQIPQALCSALRIELGQRTTEQFTRRPLPGMQSLDLWREWSCNHLYVLRPRLDSMQQAARGQGRQSWELKELKGLVGALEDLARASGDWVEDRSAWAAKERIGFEPLSPAPYAERLLFQGIKHVLLMSATLRPKHLELLGLSMADVEFAEFPSNFPVVRRPVTHVKTVQHKASMSVEAKVEAVRRVDQIIAGRLDRKWLIDTVSFDRSAFIREHSQYGYFMVANTPSKDGLSAADAMERFKAADPPQGLIGPSFRTGYDLPGQLCEFAILFKVPFMDGRNPLTAARRAADPLWEKLAVMVEIVQFFGRGMRSAADQCEGFIVDDQFSWFFRDCAQLGFVPQWFISAVRLNQAIPRPLAKLEGGQIDGYQKEDEAGTVSRSDQALQGCVGCREDSNGSSR